MQEQYADMVINHPLTKFHLLGLTYSIHLKNNHRFQGSVRYIKHWYRASQAISRLRHVAVTDL